MNIATQEPFDRATRDLIGQESCYPLLAVGKLGEKSGWKLYAGINNIEPEKANEISRLIDKYNEAKKQADEEDQGSIVIEDYIKDKTLLDLFNKSRNYQNIVDNGRIHACGRLCFNGDHKNRDVIGYGDIRYEIGLTRVASKTGSSYIVACVEGGLLDAYGYCKDDFLIVDVVGIIYKLYHAIGREVPSVSELRQMVANDPETWRMYEIGATCCLNQCERSSTTKRVMQYKPRNVRELAAFIAAIRPGFKSLLNHFLARKKYTSGEPKIDELLSDSAHYMLFQESIMKVLGFLGLEMGETYKVIKSISKKKLKGEKKEKLLDELQESWQEEFGNTRNFQNVWNVISDAARYSFNCVSGDTVIQKPGGSGKLFKPTVEEQYLIMNSRKYAKETGHEALHKKYNRYGYGMGFSMGDDNRIYKNRIENIIQQPNAQIFLLTTQNNCKVKLTENHKVPTTQGIKYVKDLKIGDVLYKYGEYEHKPFDTSFTYEKVATNLPIKGEQGFQYRPNGASVLYDEFRDSCKKLEKSCECCGKKYSTLDRFEVHHKDFNRKHNDTDNFEWLCVSCHKKKHYKHGRTKNWENGIPTVLETIKSIEPCGVETVYDVTMSGDVAHNFVVNDGLVVCNSSHALAMACDSLYEAWMKAHHRSVFYEVTLNHYQDKEDKDKVAALVYEACNMFGYRMGKYEYGADNSKFTVDDETKIIYPNLASVKGIGEKAVLSMMDIATKGYDNIIDVYLDIKGTNINATIFRNLVKIGYFKCFGSAKRILQILDIVDYWKGRKTIKKNQIEELGLSGIDLTQYATDLLKSGEHSKTQWSGLDWRKLVEDLCKDIPDDEYPFMVLAKFQYKVLGYCDMINPDLDERYKLVMQLDTTYSPKFNAYCFKDGKIKEVKIHKGKKGKDIKASYKDSPFEDGDVIYVKQIKTLPKRQNIDGKWVPVPGMVENWIKDYVVVR